MNKQLVTVKCKDGSIKIIKRKLWAEMFGNFNPIFCRYNKQRYLVKSEQGDLSDPFRRKESYLTSLYIEEK